LCWKRCGRGVVGGCLAFLDPFCVAPPGLRDFETSSGALRHRL